MIERVLPRLAVLSLALNAALAQAAPPIPGESGWSGFINIGAGVGQSETNMLASISSIDLGEDKIANLSEDAGSEDIALPALRFGLAYTLGDSLTQFYLRNQVSDSVALDLEVHGGVRQQVGEIGLFDLSLSSSSLATDVWKDPYLVGANRGDTERTSTGLHLAWHSIFNTPLALEYSSKELEIDDEESGVSLELSPADQRLLRRQGQVYRTALHYDWKISERHSVVPTIAYLDYKLDGGAMAEDGIGLHLAHHYTGERWRFVSKIFYHGLEADTDNPIYDDSADRETLGVALAAFYARPFGWENWTATAGASYREDDNDIDFYDASLGLVTVGMLYRFD